ncbi:MAG: DUF4091 domain-containing protein [Ruminococcaceae bacterium]|nr:DUF4091 domain-containing protein [Oscillospiraceae bacterium]
MNTTDTKIRPLSSMAKVFHDKIVGKNTRFIEGAAGQEISFQVAFKIEKSTYIKKERTLIVEVGKNIDAAPEIFKVENVPSYLATYPHRYDKKYISRSAGLFPDPLVPICNGDKVIAAMRRWHAVWISLKIPADHKACTEKVTVKLLNSQNEVVAKTTFTVRIHAISELPAPLPFTQWVHYDCMADVHGVKIFSEKHWSLIEKYVRMAAEHGINILYTPILTPPLDTAIGGERPTVQLVDITLDNGVYSFDFSRLTRFIELARLAGFEHFEINHMFTQWGATAAPKVVAKVNGRSKKIFGWNTDASGEEYQNFISALIPAVIAHFESHGISRDNLYFHVSDEPSPEHLDSYRKVSKMFKPLIEGCKHIDALSHLEFYNEKLVGIPVVGTDTRMNAFLEANVKGIWCYYCCGQSLEVSNRFFAMPSPRTRMIGVQIYKFDFQGFLHWGYNFYYTQHSTRLVDPWRETDAGEAFASGDAFSVYPYGDGVVPSLRLKVFKTALDDIRLLKLAEQKVGRDAVIEAIDRIAGRNITLRDYPITEKFFEQLYEYIFSVIEG